MLSAGWLVLNTDYNQLLLERCFCALSVRGVGKRDLQLALALALLGMSDSFVFTLISHLSNFIPAEDMLNLSFGAW